MNAAKHHALKNRILWLERRLQSTKCMVILLVGLLIGCVSIIYILKSQSGETLQLYGV